MGMTNRRYFSKRIAGAGIALFAGAQETRAQSSPPAGGGRKTLRMKITKVEPIMTGSDVFLKIETDYSMEDIGQLKTRVEAFLEILKDGARA